MCGMCSPASEPVILTTPEGMFPEKPLHWIVQYKKDGRWSVPAKRYDRAEADALYNAWSNAPALDEVMLTSSQLGVLGICYPSQRRTLSPTGEISEPIL